MNASDFLGIDHIQLLCPVGGEARAREFWCGVVGLAEVPKPEQLAETGGLWLRCGAQGIHIGAEPQFLPSHRAHPALRLASAVAWDALVVRLRSADVEMQPALIPISERRMKVRDPFGNLIEFVLGTTG
jgi:hypothetical protein